MDELFAPPKKKTGTLGQLYNRVHRSLREAHRNIDIVDVRDWAEEGQEEILRHYGQGSEEHYDSATKGTDYDTPEDCLQIDAVMYESGGLWKYYEDYNITAMNKIRFDHDGDFKLLYREQPVPLEAEHSENLQVHGVYHRPLVDYVLYRYWTLEGEADRGMVFYESFMRQSARNAEMIQEKQKRTRRVRPYYGS